MRPHCYFFDEAFSEKYYKSDTIKSFVAQADLMLIVGSSLASTYTRQLAFELLNKELPVIEVNP